MPEEIENLEGEPEVPQEPVPGDAPPQEPAEPATPPEPAKPAEKVVLDFGTSKYVGNTVEEAYAKLFEGIQEKDRVIPELQKQLKQYSIPPAGVPQPPQYPQYPPQAQPGYPGTMQYPTYPQPPYQSPPPPLPDYVDDPQGFQRSIDQLVNQRLGATVPQLQQQLQQQMLDNLAVYQRSNDSRNQENRFLEKHDINELQAAQRWLLENDSQAYWDNTINQVVYTRPSALEFAIRQIHGGSDPAQLKTDRAKLMQSLLKTVGGTPIAGGGGEPMSELQKLEARLNDKKLSEDEKDAIQGRIEELRLK